MYTLRPPEAALAPFIEHYWFVEPDGRREVDLRVDVFVDGRADLIFNFGAPYRRTVIGGTTRVCAVSNLDAQRLVPIRIVQKGRVRIVGVRFRLGGLGAFASTPLSRFTGRTAPPLHVLGETARRLEKQLSVAPTADAQALVLNAFFAAQLDVRPPWPEFWVALQSLIESDGARTVAEASRAAGTSPRHLARLFGRHLGIPPKTVARILRFQRALRSLMQDPSGPLADVASDAGYFDQAHFIREFKQFTGGVPRGYRGYYPPDAPQDFAPNVVSFVQDAPRSVGKSPRARGTENRPQGEPMAKHWSGKGTQDDPWQLKTPPLSSSYSLYRDETVDPPLLICQVGSTKLTYLARAVDDLHAMLKKHGDWVPLGAADEQKEAAEGTVEAWGRAKTNPVGGWYGQKKGFRGRFGMYLPPLLEALGKAEVEHNARNNRMRAK